MVDPKQMLRNIFCALVRPRTLEHHRQQGNLVWTTLNMQNSMEVLFSTVFSWKHSFWVSLAQKMNIVSFSWNLIHSLTQICSAVVHSFYFLTILLFMVNLFQKIKIVCWSLNFEPRLTWLCKTRWWCSFFLF